MPPPVAPATGPARRRRWRAALALTALALLVPAVAVPASTLAAAPSDLTPSSLATSVATPAPARPTTPPPSTSPPAPAPAGGTAAPAGRATTASRQLSAGGAQRSYVLHVPPASGPRPLLIALHGKAQGTASIRESSGFEALADARGFVVAFPASLHGGWNAGTCCAGGSARGVHDVEFLDAVIDDVAAATPVDLQRVYVVGFSNGGMLAYRYGCERSERVAGIGVVSGAMVADSSYAAPRPPACRPTRPVPLVHVHGDADTSIAQAGGYQEQLGSDTTASTTSVRAYVAAAGCRGSSLSRTGRASKRTYSACSTTAAGGSGEAVQFVRIAGLGHTWTRSGYGFDTSVGVWSFLSRHRIP